jgi:hypothetical protein
MLKLARMRAGVRVTTKLAGLAKSHPCACNVWTPRRAIPGRGRGQVLPTRTSHQSPLSGWPPYGSGEVSKEVACTAMVPIRVGTLRRKGASTFVPAICAKETSMSRRSATYFVIMLLAR